MSFAGKKVLIVGGGSSISEDIVNIFLAKGADLMLTINNHNPAYLDKNRIKTARLDLTSFKSMDKFCSESLSIFGDIDIVIFLAGVLPGKALADYEDQLMETVMRVNFTGQASFLKRILPHLKPGASVILMSSISGERGSFDPIYAASKAAQIGFVKSLASWLAPKIRINAISPSLIDESSMFHDMDINRREFHKQQSPTKKLISKPELAKIIINLCEPSSSEINGQVVSVYGGLY
jgi:NAD(P)-dependent dehydrogenase (short-subunit alcohol dehydrogenase family)